MTSTPVTDEAQGPAKKRQRLLYSCTECHRRKQKCNRETPCQHCILRRAPHLCLQYRPGYDTLDTDSRISRLELALDRGIEQVLDRLSALEQRGDGYGDGAGTDRRPSGSKAVSTHKAGQADDFVGTATPSASTAHANLAEPRGFEPLAMTLPYDSASSTYASLRAHLYPGAEGEDSSESRLTAPTSRLLQELPDRNRCRKLLQHFFEKVNHLHMPLPDTLLSSLDVLIQGGPVLKANDLHRFSILAGILSLVLISAPDELLLGGPTTRFTEARSLLDAAHLALLTAESLQVADLERVLAWVMLSRVLQIDGRASDSWSAATRAITSAYTINLHREPSMAIESQYEEQERRRTWLMAYYQEKSLSVILNRQSTIRDELCTTLSPHLSPRQDSALSISTFHLFHSLAKLMGQVNVIVQSTDGNSHFDEVLKVDAEICKLRDTLPPYFRRLDTHQLHDGEVPVFFGNSVRDMEVAHQWLTVSEIDHLRIALHRPFLSPSSVGSQHSRAASIEASSSSLTRRSALVRVFRKQYGNGRVPRWYANMLNQSQRFNLVLTCCVSLLLNPRDGDAVKLRALIEEYMSLLPRRTWRSIEDADYRRAKSFERELKVLQLFLDRANRLSAPQAPIQEGQTSDGPNPVGINGSESMTMAPAKSSNKDDDFAAQTRDAPDSTLWQFYPIAEDPLYRMAIPPPSDEQQATNASVDRFFDTLAQGQTDEAEMQNSILEALGSIPWSFE